MSHSSRSGRAIAIAAAACAVALAVPAAQQTTIKRSYPLVRDMRGVVPPGPRVAPYNSPPLGDGPWQFETYEQRNIKVSVVTKGLSHPWSLAFLPGGDMLITERIGRLRVVRNGKLDPMPLPGIPKVTSVSTMAGLMDIALHPRFADNKWVYISYHKPRGTAPDVNGKDFPVASNSILRGTWNGAALVDIKDVYVSDDVDTEMSRIAFGRDGMLYMTVSAPGVGPEIVRSQDPDDYAGKVIRLRDDGTVPPDNPFIGKAGYKPAVYTLGHRNGHGLAVNPETGELWMTEQGPDGGDEINIIKAGGNYGWPLVSLGRSYAGPYQPGGFQAEGMTAPVVNFVPSISATGMTFYTGDRFPAWKGNLFIGGVRYGEVPGTGRIQRIVFNSAMEETSRETLLEDKRWRVRDIRQGPDGLLYVITDERNGALLRIEPAE